MSVSEHCANYDLSLHTGLSALINSYLQHMQQLTFSS